MPLICELRFFRFDFFLLFTLKARKRNGHNYWHYFHIRYNNAKKEKWLDQKGTTSELCTTFPSQIEPVVKRFRESFPGFANTYFSIFNFEKVYTSASPDGYHFLAVLNPRSIWHMLLLKQELEQEIAVRVTSLGIGFQVQNPTGCRDGARTEVRAFRYYNEADFCRPYASKVLKAVGNALTTTDGLHVLCFRAANATEPSSEDPHPPPKVEGRSGPRPIACPFGNPIASFTRGKCSRGTASPRSCFATCRPLSQVSA